jgi:hypothetical protein
MHVENWSDVRGDSLLLGQLAKDVESQDQLRSKFFVYRKDDLISVRNQITEFLGMINNGILGSSISFCSFSSDAI